MTREELLAAQYAVDDEPPTKTFRDELAMAAVAGLLARGGDYTTAAEIAYRIADAMLHERKRSA